jgi:hypothetical protein
MHDPPFGIAINVGFFTRMAFRPFEEVWQAINISTRYLLQVSPVTLAAKPNFSGMDVDRAFYKNPPNRSLDISGQFLKPGAHRFAARCAASARSGSGRCLAQTAGQREKRGSLSGLREEDGLLTSSNGMMPGVLVHRATKNYSAKTPTHRGWRFSCPSLES